MTGTRRFVYLAAAVLLSFVNGCQTSQLPPHRAYANDAEVPRISVEEAKKDYDAGIVVMVDSRPEATWALERVAGSVNIPYGTGSHDFSTLPPDKKIIVYCS